MENDIYKKFENKLKNMNENELFCIYIDFPFCKSKCEYCIYNSIPYLEGKELREEYVDSFFKQLDFYKSLFNIRTPDSIYFGGGTPSLWRIDELDRIIGSIPEYEKIKMKKTETHPSDLDDERIKYYAEVMKMNVVSVGVQSFDKNSCIGQKRIWVDKYRIKHIVDEFHKYGIFVNIDLVALFNGDEEENWNIFEEDMNIACNVVKPDIITSIPNYKTKLVYIEQIPRFRNILKKYVGVSYFPLSKKMLSLDMNEINKYGENDHWIATPKYWEYQEKNIRYSSSHPAPTPPQNQVTISFGGAQNHVVYSYISSDEYVVYSAFNTETKTMDYFYNHRIKNIES